LLAVVVGLSSGSIAVQDTPPPPAAAGGISAEQDGQGQQPARGHERAQPIVTLSMGGGFYARSAGNWGFDLENNRTLIPVGIGDGPGLQGPGWHRQRLHRAAFQLFTGLLQWSKKPKA
jgi:hypothetical protein